jgi:SEC-C motif-containing protein
MRARYSAFVVHDADYLLRTWHPTTRPLDIGRWQRWTRLDVLAADRGGLLDAEGTVAFDAHHDRGVLHEVSRFARHDGRWVYVAPVELTET